MPKYINTNPKYGDEGPHEADCTDDLAWEIQPLIEEWAAEKWEDYCDIFVGRQRPPRPRQGEFVRKAIEDMRVEFLDGLEVFEEEPPTDKWTLADIKYQQWKDGDLDD